MASKKSRTDALLESPATTVTPRGILKELWPEEIVPSRNNPRHLFDEEPLRDLRDSIREHGVLVPITVYPIKGQDKYRILDGERRYRCCLDLQKEGRTLRIPANIVEPPSKVAGLLYMFSIHNFRESWELMPTALSLQIVMQELGEADNLKLQRLTGLSGAQIERCKKLLTFPKRFQDLSLDPNPKTRIPSNFWIEALPVLDLCQRVLPTVSAKLGRDGLTDRLVEKYRAKRIRSVIHFRRIMEAYDLAESLPQKKAVIEALERYLTDVDLETRRAFDQFVVDNRRIQSAINSCKDFIGQLERAKLDFAVDNAELVSALEEVRKYVDSLLQRLAGSDAPSTQEADEEQS